MQENMPRKSKFFILSAICVFFVGGIFLSIILSNLLFTPASSTDLTTVTSPSFEIHFIALNKSQLEASANSLCEDYQKLGAGGYVWQQGQYYYVFSSGFENKADAELVQSNLSSTHSISSEIITINFDAFTLTGNFTTENKKILEKALSSFFEAYKSLYDIAISLDTQVYNVLAARLAVNNVHSRLASIKADFQTVFSVEPSLSKFAQYLNDEVEISQKLINEELISPSQTYASLVKYRYIEILKCYYDLAKGLK